VVEADRSWWSELESPDEHLAGILVRSVIVSDARWPDRARSARRDRVPLGKVLFYSGVDQETIWIRDPRLQNP